jgi:hypothetical protein
VEKQLPWTFVHIPVQGTSHFMDYIIHLITTHVDLFATSALALQLYLPIAEKTPQVFNMFNAHISQDVTM